jgi:hypothetical protein
VHSLLDFLNENNVESRVPGEDHHVNRNWLGVRCPRCGSSSFHGGFHESGAYSCWSCGTHNPAEVLSELTGRPIRECWHVLKSSDFPFPAKQERTGKLSLPPDVGPLQKQHRTYLKQRGFDPDEIETTWGVRGIGLSSRKWAWRLFLPIHDRDGREVSWTTRRCSDDDPVQRYISASGEQQSFPAKQLLYGEHLVRGHAVIVVEGPLDAWAVGPGAVAVMGTSYTEEQAAMIAEHSVRIICFDREPDAQRRAEKLKRDLSVLPGDTTNHVCKTGKDASRVSARELRKIRRLLS